MPDVASLNTADSAYTLAWPAGILAAELRWVLRRAPDFDSDVAELLLEEAFVADEPRDEFRSAVDRSDPFDRPSPYGASNGKLDLLRQVLAEIDRLPEQRRPRPYWHQRQGVELQAPPNLLVEQQRGQRLQVAWANTIGRFASGGYLEHVAPSPCVDDDDPPPDPDDVVDQELERRLGIPGLWPLRPGEWDDDTFYSLIEALGDLVARPRHRRLHNYNRCGWHYSQFASGPGRALYRSAVNDLLDQSDVGLRLADDGEDVGRLVHAAGDDREHLIERTLHSPDPDVRDDAGHAVALFRSRTATTVERRSAVVALAGILERRRALLRSELFRRDEGALFRIANEFDVRHRDKSQQTDYDPVFLDWLFWWYLATVELTDRLLARQADASVPVPGAPE